MNCETCGKNHTGDYGSGRFCSTVCARSFSSKESRQIRNEKISNALRGRSVGQNQLPTLFCEFCSKGYVKATSFRTHIGQCPFNPGASNRETRREKKREDLLSLPFEMIPTGLIKERLLRDQQGRCNRCGLSEWLGQKITLELEHKGGNHYDNSRLNIELLCPNCHSLTDTWRGRNKSKEKTGKRVSDEELANAIASTSTIRQALIKVGLAAKGGNYIRAKAIKQFVGV